MGLNEIQKALEAEAGISVCPICGTPYKAYNSRQKTCGAPSCQKIQHSKDTLKNNEIKKAKDPEGYRANKREIMRRYRQKKKALQTRERQLKELSDNWEKRLDFDKKVSDYGIEYGKRSAEKVLANVPKIDVGAYKKGDKDEQDLL